MCEKCIPSVLHAKPILEVPSGFPILSCARYNKKSVSFLTVAAGLKTSFASHATCFFLIGSKNLSSCGTITGFTESTFVKGNNSQFFVTVEEVSFVNSLFSFVSFLHEAKKSKQYNKQSYNFICIF